jgi:phosphoenolpyruvate carboxykinase (ATP)
MALHPTVYARLLEEKIERHRVQCWLVNPGWTGGPYGVGQRLKMAHTRAMVNAALCGELDRGGFEPDPVLGVQVPPACRDVPSEVLKPRETWEDKGLFDQQSRKLAQMFAESFQQFEDALPDDVRAAGPLAP